MTRAATATWPSRFACTRTRRLCSGCCATPDLRKRATTICPAVSSRCTAATRSDMPATPAWLALLEAVLNRNIDAQSAASEIVRRRLEGKSLQVDVEGFLRLRAEVF